MDGRLLHGVARGGALALAALITLTTPLAGQNNSGSTNDSFVPNEKPQLDVRRAAGAITIDGRLDDAGWVNAAQAMNFAENFPVEKGRPSVPSEVWVAYDDEHLYLAYIAWDDPSTIRASLTDRDRIWQDDYFGILLDTYGDASWAYFLFANPLGIQGDSRFWPWESRRRL